MALLCQGNECDQWPGSCLDRVVMVAHPIPFVFLVALIKSFTFVPGGGLQ